jgi:hypothetical protein
MRKHTLLFFSRIESKFVTHLNNLHYSVFFCKRQKNSSPPKLSVLKGVFFSKLQKLSIWKTLK